LNARALRTLTAAPALASLTRLELGCAGTAFTPPPATDGNRAARLLAESPHLAGLRVLGLRNSGLREEGLEALASAGALRLSALDVGHNWRLGSPALQILAGSENFAELTALDLTSVRVGYTGVHDLLTSPNLARLSALYLHQSDLNPTDLRILAASPRVAGLTALGLGAAPLGDGFAPLLRALATGRLTELSLPGAALGPASVRALADWPGLGRLTTLDLSACGLDAARLGVLLASPHWGRLTVLRLANNPLGDAGARLLAEAARALGRLRCLELNNCGLGEEGVRALAHGPALRRLERLVLGEYRYGEGLLRAVAESSALARLRTLDLHQRPDEGETRLLLESPGLPALIRLQWNGEDVGEVCWELRIRRVGPLPLPPAPEEAP
jgi:hypothetical protein